MELKNESLKSVDKNYDNLNKDVFNKVLAIDFETANASNNTACSIGFALLEHGEITLSEEILINPESHFSDKNIEIHNITPKMVKDKEIFPVVWKEVSKLIDDNTLVIAHNTSADMVILSKLAGKYNMAVKDFPYLCTVEAYKKNGSFSKFGLKSIANELGLDFEHHNAKEDALVCLKIFMNLLDDKKFITKEFIEKTLGLKTKRFAVREEDKSFKRKFFKQNTFKASDITTTNTEFDENHPVYKKIFVTTGDLVNIDKKDAAQRVVDLGGTFKDGFIKATDYLVVGLNEYKEPSINTTKYTKAMEKINKGGVIEIINEEEFLNLLDWPVKNTSENINEDVIIDNSNEIASIDSNESDNVCYKESKNSDDKEKYTNSDGIENIKQLNRTQESLEQLTFDMLIPSANISKENEEKKIEKVAEEIDIFSNKYIEPKGQWIKFEAVEDKLAKLKEYKLLSAKATDPEKKFYYKGLYVDKAVNCSILGYLDNDVLVIEVEGNLHSIRGEYLKQMQDTNFNKFDSIL